MHITHASGPKANFVTNANTLQIFVYKAVADKIILRVMYLYIHRYSLRET